MQHALFVWLGGGDTRLTATLWNIHLGNAHGSMHLAELYSAFVRDDSSSAISSLARLLSQAETELAVAIKIRQYLTSELRVLAITVRAVSNTHADPPER